MLSLTSNGLRAQPPALLHLSPRCEVCDQFLFQRLSFHLFFFSICFPLPPNFLPLVLLKNSARLHLKQAKANKHKVKSKQTWRYTHKHVILGVSLMNIVELFVFLIV